MSNKNQLLILAVQTQAEALAAVQREDKTKRRYKMKLYYYYKSVGRGVDKESFEYVDTREKAIEIIENGEDEDKIFLRLEDENGNIDLQYED